MESKRKASSSAASVSEVDGRAAKRIKPAQDPTDGETAESTSEHGLKFLEQLRRTADKSGRLVTTNFLTLPNKKDVPDYYEVIKMPIALDTVEAKLKRREFPTMTTLESYLKRMVANAKDYNQRGSEIFDDAERIRKAVSNYMTKHNPAYKTPGYVAFATPLPENDDSPDSEEDAEGEIDDEVPVPVTPVTNGKRPVGRPRVTLKVNGARASATPARSTPQRTTEGFSGLDFQGAQDKIIYDLIKELDPEDENAYRYACFHALPPRALKDYYQVILHPVSLKSVQKLVRGQHGRNGTTGVSDFKSWKAFEDEVSSIWKNATHYNEDGSDIANLAHELEASFYKLLNEAKKHVTEPPQPKIKLKTATAAEPSPKITLRVGTKPEPAATPATNTSNATRAPLESPSTATRRNPPGSSQYSSATAANPAKADQVESTSGSAASPIQSSSAAIKNEDLKSPAPGRPASSGPQQLQYGTSMLPPGTITPGMTNGNAQQNGQVPAYIQTPNPAFESKWRQPGKNASDAMLMNINLATHPGLNIPRHFRMDVRPSDTLTQQSITVNLPPTHYYMQIVPTIAPSVLSRQHKLFVTAASTRLHPLPKQAGGTVDAAEPLFDARLLPGVNRIEIELIATLPKGAKAINGQEVELEKVTIFANLMR